MITPELKEVYITEIGSDYGNKILNFAKKKRFKKERGGGFYTSTTFFRDIMNGYRENLRAERFIHKVYEHYKKENELHAKKVASVLAAQ
ncbi:hypothetical protein [Zunongwangia atlantica]|uniref:Uncharacterized protein n=1 Tax=Zunongwangia atlantica 22II14-10F7 TaxID=1185767 RepID=A0A1Y1SZ86_9FLAO|nr:hypothetical protein [Zunongwangia atlantica]ORL43714.1 hypothetical protein IIF7_19489 [Zunongwangia atlantica 22II14-10F7]